MKNSTQEILKDFKSKINKGFRALRKAGYTAKQNFMCCQNCGCAALYDNESEKYVFYHKQDAEYLKKNGNVYLAHRGNGEEIVKILRDSGLIVEWDGDDSHRIKLLNSSIEMSEMV